MKVFISWSGDRSKAIAQALYEWLPYIDTRFEPWMSEIDIRKGTSGRREIAEKLEERDFGIICLTPENTEEPWLNFEAGALSKNIDEAYVWTYLYELEYSDIEGPHPLADFQHTQATKEDTKKLIDTMNKALEDEQQSEKRIDTAFEKWWNELEERLEDIPDTEEDEEDGRSSEDIVREILEIVRSLRRGSFRIPVGRVKNPDKVVVDRNIPDNTLLALRESADIEADIEPI